MHETARARLAAWLARPDVAALDPAGVEALRAALAALRDEGIEAHGQIAHPDPYTAAMQVIEDERVDEVIREMERRNRRARDPLLVERMEQLERVKDRAVHVCFGDNPGCDKSYLSAVVIPGEPLIFDYESAEHEESVQPLIERCAKILGYGTGKAIPGDLTANLLPLVHPGRR